MPQTGAQSSALQGASAGNSSGSKSLPRRIYEITAPKISAILRQLGLIVRSLSALEYPHNKSPPNVEEIYTSAGGIRVSTGKRILSFISFLCDHPKITLTLLFLSIANQTFAEKFRDIDFFSPQVTTELLLGCMVLAAVILTILLIVNIRQNIALRKAQQELREKLDSFYQAASEFPLIEGEQSVTKEHPVIKKINTLNEIARKLGITGSIFTANDQRVLVWKREFDYWISFLKNYFFKSQIFHFFY